VTTDTEDISIQEYTDHGTSWLSFCTLEISLLMMEAARQFC